jgi:chemotaxis protein CheX
MSLALMLCGATTDQRIAPMRGLLEADGINCRCASLTAPLVNPIPDAAVVLDDGNDAVLRLIIALRAAGAAVFTVSAVSSRERFGRLMAAGSTGVLPPDVSDERIAAEVEALADLRRQAEKGPNQALQPFLAATLEAWQLMASSRARLSGVRAKREYRMPGDLTALIYLLGGAERVLALSLSNESAMALSKRVLGAHMPEPEPEIIHDTVAEMANVVAGQVKGRFDGTAFEFDISMPTVIAGSPHHLMHRPDLPCYEMAFTSDCGPFHLQLCVRGRTLEIQA